MALENPTPAAEQGSGEAQVLARYAGALLVASALFFVATIVTFGTYGKKNPWVWVFLVLAALCGEGWYSGRRQARKLARDRYARQRNLLGANATATLLLTLVLLVGINYIAARRHKTFDLTSNHSNSISEQSVKALQGFPGTATFTYVYSGPQNEAVQSALALLNSYKNASDKVRVRILNAAADYMDVINLNLVAFTGEQPVLLIQSSEMMGPGARQQVLTVDEQNITSALLKFTKNKPLVIYFLTGHGEFSPDSTNPTQSLSSVKRLLEGQNYVVKATGLLGVHPSVPADAAALLVCSPKSDLAPAEETALKQYIAGNGRLVLMRGFSEIPLPRWDEVAQALGVEVHPGIILDEVNAVQSAAFPEATVNDNTTHPLMRGVSSNTKIVFPIAAPLKIAAKPPPGITATALLSTSNQSESKTPHDAAKPEPGPFVLAAAVERGANSPSGSSNGDTLRAVVTGNATFADDGNCKVGGNSSFFLAAVNWAVGQDALVSIPPKPPVTNTLTMPVIAQRFATLFCLFVLPILSLILGAVVWWNRR